MLKCLRRKKNRFPQPFSASPTLPAAPSPWVFFLFSEFEIFDCARQTPSIFVRHEKLYTLCIAETRGRENFAPKTFPKHFHTQSILVIGRYALFPSVFLVFPMKNVALNETEKSRAAPKKAKRKKFRHFLQPRAEIKRQREKQNSLAVAAAAAAKGKAKEKFNFTNHSRVITWKMNFFVSFQQGSPSRSRLRARSRSRSRLRSADGKVAHPLPLLPWQTNNSQFVRFNFCVFLRNFSILLCVLIKRERRRAKSMLKQPAAGRSFG